MRPLFLPYRKVLRICHMVKSNYRTAAEWKHVAAAPRRRRRILQAGHFFTIWENSPNLPYGKKQ